MELGGIKVTGANASIESNTRGVGMGGSIKIEVLGARQSYFIVEQGSFNEGGLRGCR